MQIPQDETCKGPGRNKWDATWEIAQVYVEEKNCQKPLQFRVKQCKRDIALNNTNQVLFEKESHNISKEKKVKNTTH